jgi:catechol 2,3-dioxygenase-like lactoylglutathione lyase family enzyme
MSYVALATERYDEVAEFYGGLLGFPVVDGWDRPNGRGVRFDLGGLRLEILDNQREKSPLDLGDPADRFHVVVEVDDIDEARARIKVDTPAPQDTSWRARMFQIRDPDGTPVTFLQWLGPERTRLGKIHGCVATGVGRGSHFTRLDWARREFVDKLGIDPFPGTINLIVDDLESMSVWDQLRNAPGVRINNPGSGPNDYNARCYKVSINGRVAAAIVFPEIRDYSTNKIEIIAEIGVREALGVDDGDPLTLEIETTGEDS